MSILAQVDLTLALTPEAYAEQLPPNQAAVSQLVRQAFVQKRPVVIVFEGCEAAGQGDAIKRLTEKLDPRFCVVYRNAPAEGEDKVRPYLYRFWRRLPARGYVAIFDGSWYERVLADRVDGRCTPTEWARAYRELDQFERQLTDFGAIVVKFWLHVGADEQQRRAAAAGEPVWSATRSARYEEAAEEMLLKTSTVGAPWTIVEADDGAWAEIKVLSVTAETLARELAPQAEPHSEGPDAAGGKKAKKVKA
jgi:polyphosphate kinase 2 (PPK2 family)